ncbi:hypothetical protein DL95DRAFT_486009 [Leptodontidium sp. 2 PMI_412]|nr:hypothetical protein DL95DRAFT_486009 [Leptodontidium sp. 2 PMI_412]
MAKKSPNFPDLLNLFHSNPDRFVRWYERSHQVAESAVPDNSEHNSETLVSDLAKETGMVEKFAWSRLVELWFRETDINILGRTLQREILSCIWEDGKEYPASVKSWRSPEDLSPHSSSAEDLLTHSSSTADQILVVARVKKPASKSSPSAPKTLQQAASPSATALPATNRYDFLSQLSYSWPRRPVIWFCQVVFWIGPVYFLLHSALYLVGFIPIIGPLIRWLLCTVHNLISEETAATPPLTNTGWISGFSIHDNFIVNNIEIAEASLRLLPVARIVECSSFSLISASEIVKAPNVYFKDEMAKHYAEPLSHTRALGVSLSQFDNGVEALIRSFSIRLSLTLSRIEEIIEGSKPRYPNPVWDVAAHSTTFSSLACIILPPLVGDLDVWTRAACGISFVLWTQAHCYLSATNDPSLSSIQDPLQHPICSPIAYFGPTELGSQQLAELHAEAAKLTYEFGELVDNTLTHVLSLIETSHGSIEYGERGIKWLDYRGRPL